MIAPARQAAYAALVAHEVTGTPLPGAIAAARTSLTDPRDHSLLTELATGAVRMRKALDYQLAQRTARPLETLDPPVRSALRLGAYQLLYLDRLPPSAVVHDAVALTKRAGKSSAGALVNAVLRAVARDRAHLTWPDASHGCRSRHQILASRVAGRTMVEPLWAGVDDGLACIQQPATASVRRREPPQGHPRDPGRAPRGRGRGDRADGPGSPWATRHQGRRARDRCLSRGLVRRSGRGLTTDRGTRRPACGSARSGSLCVAGREDHEPGRARGRRWRAHRV